MLNLKYVAVEIRIRQREDDALSKILKTCHEKKFKYLKKSMFHCTDIYKIWFSV